MSNALAIELTHIEPITDIDSNNGNNDETVSQVTPIFKTSNNHLQILGARRVTHSGFTNTTRHGAKFCCPGNLALAICAPLVYGICPFRLCCHENSYIYSSHVPTKSPSTDIHGSTCVTSSVFGNFFMNRY